MPFAHRSKHRSLRDGSTVRGQPWSSRPAALVVWRRRCRIPLGAVAGSAVAYGILLAYLVLAEREAAHPGEREKRTFPASNIALALLKIDELDGSQTGASTR
mgnify:CR=1 FL=1